MSKFTTREIDWLRANYAKLGRKKCAETLGRGSNIVGFKAVSLGLRCRRGAARRQFNAASVIRCYRSLKTVERVAKHLKTGEEQVSRVLKSAGISGRPQTPFEEHKDAIVADYLEGKTSRKDIAAKYGLSDDQIKHGLKKLGLNDRSRWGHVINRKSTYEYWVAKHGKDEADRRWVEYRDKLNRNARRGKAHSRFGKPPAEGSGNGWKGWYRGAYFRSLREAMFMLNAERDGIEWKTAETKEYTVYYTFMGKTCTYRPDFIVGRDLWELKPIKLHDSPRVTAKRLAAEAFCRERGLTYRLEDIAIDKGRVHEALKDGRIRFDRDYEERLLAYIRASAA